MRDALGLAASMAKLTFTKNSDDWRYVAFEWMDYPSGGIGINVKQVAVTEPEEESWGRQSSRSAGATKAGTIGRKPPVTGTTSESTTGTSSTPKPVSR